MPLLKLITKALAIISACLGAAMTAIVSFSVLYRYVTGTPVDMQEDIVGLLFVAMVFLALPHCSVTNSQISATLIRDVLSSRWKRLCDILAQICVVVFSLFFGWIAYSYTLTSFEFGSRSMVGNILLYPWMALMPFSCLMLIVVAVVKIAGLLRGADQLDNSSLSSN
jgi:TRAP-type C4-dicarboxylate transport system permease small subunit